MVTRALARAPAAAGTLTSGWRRGWWNKRRHFPGQAQDAQAVRPVGGDGHFQDRVRQAQGLGEIPAQGEVLGNLHQTHVVGGQPQFVFGQEHAFGEVAPELRRL